MHTIRRVECDMCVTCWIYSILNLRIEHRERENKRKTKKEKERGREDGDNLKMNNQDMLARVNKYAKVKVSVVWIWNGMRRNVMREKIFGNRTHWHCGGASIHSLVFCWCFGSRNFLPTVFLVVSSRHDNNYWDVKWSRALIARHAYQAVVH